MSRMKRNAAASAHVSPTCQYDEVVGTLQALATATGADLSLEPQFSRYMCPQYVTAVIFSATDAQDNARAKVTSVSINRCSQAEFEEANAAASAGIIIPDEWTPFDSAFGMPVCWGAFGKAALDDDLTLSIFNVSTIGIDVHVTVRGIASDNLPAGWGVGKPCAVRQLLGSGRLQGGGSDPGFPPAM